MKQILTLILVATLSNAHSQFSAGMHGGSSNKNVVVGFQMQYLFQNRFTAGVNMTTHTDNSNPAYFQSRLGYTIGNYRTGLSVQPYTGYSFGINNMDKNNYGGHLYFGTQVRYQLTHVAMIYTDINMPSPQSHLITIGIAGRLPLRYE